MRLPVTSEYRLLVRHFWGRFFNADSLAVHGEPTTNLAQALGVLAVPGAFFVIICQPLNMMRWNLVAVRYWFVSFSMIAMAFLMVIEWDALFPDPVDFQVLMPLPIRLGTLFAAKLSALAMFLGVFLLDINIFAAICWPGIDTGNGLFQILIAHIGGTIAAGLFAALSVAALQGVMLTVFSPRWYRRVATLVQTLLIFTLVTMLFLTPVLATLIRRLVASGNPWLFYFPAYWFIGVYERLRPAVWDPTLFRLGEVGLEALAVSAAIFLLTYLPQYRQHARKAMEVPVATRHRRASRLSSAVDALFLKRSGERAVFHFISQTITRSGKHRIFLATYAGFGAALAITSLAHGGTGLLEMPLTLSFILVSGLRAAFNFPAELKANWALKLGATEPVDHYLAGMRKWIVICALAPLFTAIAAAEFALFRWPLALFHVAFGFTVAVLLMDLMFVSFRKLPFTCAYFPGRINLAGLGLIYLAGFTVYSRAMARLELWLSAAPRSAAVFFAVALGLHLGLTWIRRRMLSETAALDYEDEGDPVIRSLDLTAEGLPPVEQKAEHVTAG